MAKTILVGYDDKEPARRALEHAIEQAKETGAKLVVIAVAEMPLNPEGPQAFGTLGDRPGMIPLVPTPELETVLGRAEEQVSAAGLEADYMWAAGDPSGTIVETARDLKADLVVLGSHHHSGIAKIFGADTAAEVKRALGANVVVVE